MLMFQASSAPARSRILEALGQVHLADHRPLLRGQVLGGDVAAVDAAPGRAVEVEEPGAGLAQVPGDGGEQRAGAHGVAAHRLALHALPEPQERRAGTVEVRRALDVGRRHAGRALAPLGRAVGERRLELVEAGRVVGEERPVGHAVADEDVQQREGERRVGAGERLQVQVGALRGPGRDRVDRRRSCPAPRASQCSSVCGADEEGLAPQTRMQAASAADPRVEPDLRRAVDVGRARRGRRGCRPCPGRPRSPRGGARSAAGSRSRAARACRCSGC